MRSEFTRAKGPEERRRPLMSAAALIPLATPGSAAFIELSIMLALMATGLDFTTSFSAVAASLNNLAGSSSSNRSGPVRFRASPTGWSRCRMPGHSGQRGC